MWAHGGEGGVELAQKVLKVMDEQKNSFEALYSMKDSIETKIETIAKKVYGAKGVEFSTKARKQMTDFTANGWGELPVCMAKTQYSLSDDPALLGRPEGFTITVRELRPSIGAGFIVVLTGDVMTMPGLPKKPAALNMDVNKEGKIVGLF